MLDTDMICCDPWWWRLSESCLGHAALLMYQTRYQCNTTKKYTKNCQPAEHTPGSPAASDYSLTLMWFDWLVPVPDCLSKMDLFSRCLMKSWDPHWGNTRWSETPESDGPVQIQTVTLFSQDDFIVIPLFILHLRFDHLGSKKWGWKIPKQRWWCNLKMLLQ